MSYKNRTETINHIKFYYTKSELFTVTRLRTETRAKNIRDKDGKPMLDDFGMSEDEESIFENLLKKTLYEIAGISLKQTKGITDSIFVDETTDVSITGDPAVDVTNAYGFSILDNDAYNSNSLEVVDEKIKESLIVGTMAKWWKICGLKEEYAEFERDYLIEQKELIEKLFDLRKPLIA